MISSVKCIIIGLDNQGQFIVIFLKNQDVGNVARVRAASCKKLIRKNKSIRKNKLIRTEILYLKMSVLIDLFFLILLFT